jgi:hypothetical protein
MLIDEVIEKAKALGKLIPARPVAPWAGEKRAFLMCAALQQAIEVGRMSAENAAKRRWAQLVADMGHFVEGGLITEKLIKQLDPKKFEHWELISRRPSPSLRVFGRFAKPDVFIGTHVIVRSGLGKKWSDKWEHEKLVCEDHWNAAGFSNLDPFTGDKYEHYMTENARRKLKVE